MESKHERKVIVFFFLLLSFICTMCSKDKEISPSKTNGGLNLSLPSNVKNGDLICRLGNGYFSSFFQKLNGENSRFSHIGIVACEGDSLFIYHSEASEFTGVGEVMKSSAVDFISESLEWEVFPLKDSLLGEKVVEWAEFYERKPTPFDTDFDANNDSALYCTEYVARCINLACCKDTIQPTGEIQGKRFYRIGDIINVLD